MNAIRLSTAALIGMAAVLSLAPSQAKSLVESTPFRNNPMYSVSNYKQINKAEIAWNWKPEAALPFRLSNNRQTPVKPRYREQLPLIGGTDSTVVISLETAVANRNYKSQNSVHGFQQIG